jgi:PKD repeat protein
VFFLFSQSLYNTKPYTYPPISTTYTLTVSNDFGCMALDSVFVIIDPKPLANFTYEKDNKTINFDDTKERAITSWEWGFGDRSPSEFT